MAAPLSLAEAKQSARTAALAARAACDPACGAALAAYVPASISPGTVVAGFWPLPGEIDIRPLLQALHAAGHPICLPRTPPRGQPLSFHAWAPGQPLIPGRFGTLAPDGPAARPAVLLVPLLAFDRQGRRLGYGAGYYDRTLAGLPRAHTIGCAFAAQEVPAVPAGAQDMPLQAVATEHGFIPIRT